MKYSTALAFILPSLVAAALETDQSALKDVVSLGDRPYFLLDVMKPSSLKDKLEHCAASNKSIKVSDFSIGHRGACMQYPEHTLESYKAAAIQGAGVIECDVTFTKDKQLVCRHSQCDLHTTTDVVTRPDMNAKCTTPFVAGSSDGPKCCTSDFTLAELKTLCAKMDSSGGVPADTAEEYAFGGTADWRTDLYQDSKCHEIPTHKESIQIIKSLGRKFTPELKTPSVDMPYEGTFSQEDYAQMMINEYIQMGIPPKDVWPQSFLTSDVYYWIANTAYGDQAVALDDKYDDPNYRSWHSELAGKGVKIVAPPMWMLVESDPSAELGIAQSDYTKSAKEHGLDIITWTLERTDPGLNGWYWQTLQGNDLNDGDKFALLYSLHQMGVLGVFSDWPATVTFFGNCIKGKPASKASKGTKKRLFNN